MPIIDIWSLFTDAHAHLPENPTRDDQIDVPVSAKILLNSTRSEDFPRVARLAKKFPAQIVPAFGVHPWFAEEWNPEIRKYLSHFLSDIPGATIGEIGLDRCRNNFPAQEAAFREQLAVAAEFHVPVTLHIVRTFGKTEEILREFSVAGTLPPFLLHAYSGSPEQAKIFAGFGGAFSAPRKKLPPECLVVYESDKPLS